MSLLIDGGHTGFSYKNPTSPTPMTENQNLEELKSPNEKSTT
jgi:hypothetical protein